MIYSKNALFFQLELVLLHHSPTSQIKMYVDICSLSAGVEKRKAKIHFCVETDADNQHYSFTTHTYKNNCICRM